MRHPLCKKPFLGLLTFFLFHSLWNNPVTGVRLPQNRPKAELSSSTSTPNPTTSPEIQARLQHALFYRMLYEYLARCYEGSCPTSSNPPTADPFDPNIPLPVAETVGTPVVKGYQHARECYRKNSWKDPQTQTEYPGMPELVWSELAETLVPTLLKNKARKNLLGLNGRPPSSHRDHSLRHQQRRNTSHITKQPEISLERKQSFDHKVPVAGTRSNGIQSDIASPSNHTRRVPVGAQKPLDAPVPGRYSLLALSNRLLKPDDLSKNNEPRKLELSNPPVGEPSAAQTNGTFPSASPSVAPQPNVSESALKLKLAMESKAQDTKNKAAAKKRQHESKSKLKSHKALMEKNVRRALKKIHQLATNFGKSAKVATATELELMKIFPVPTPKDELPLALPVEYVPGNIDCPVDCDPTICDDPPSKLTQCFSATSEEELAQGEAENESTTPVVKKQHLCRPFSNPSTLECPTGFVRCSLATPTRNKVVTLPVSSVTEPLYKNITIDGYNMHQCLRLLFLPPTTQCDVSSLPAMMAATGPVMGYGGNAAFPQVKGNGRVAQFSRIQMLEPGTFQMCIVQFGVKPSSSTPVTGKQETTPEEVVVLDAVSIGTVTGFRPGGETTQTPGPPSTSTSTVHELNSTLAPTPGPQVSAKPAELTATSLAATPLATSTPPNKNTGTSTVLLQPSAAVTPSP